MDLIQFLINGIIPIFLELPYELTQGILCHCMMYHLYVPVVIHSQAYNIV